MKLFKAKRRKLNCCVRLYMYVRRKAGNPIIFVNNKERMKGVLNDMQNGETQVLSSIEYAILNDVK